MSQWPSVHPAFYVLKEAALRRFRTKLSHLILHVTNLCNFRCQHCFVEFEKRPQDLSLEEIKEIAASVSDLLWLDIGGGEPFVRNDLADILQCFKAHEISIPTNGWFTDRCLSTIGEIEKRIDLHRLILTLSIDGLEKTHDEIRKKAGSFQRLCATYHALRTRFPQLRLKINTVLHDKNLSEVIPLMEWVQKTLNPAFHSVLLLRGSPINPERRLPSPAALRELEERMHVVQQRYMYGRRGFFSVVQRHYQWLKREISTQTLERQTQVIPCFAGQVHAVIYANGAVAPCELLPAVGNVRETPLPQILNGTLWKEAVDRIQKKACHCTHDCNMLDNVLLNTSLYPKLLFGRSTPP